MEDFFFYSSLKIVIETHCQSGFGLMGWSKRSACAWLPVATWGPQWSFASIVKRAYHPVILNWQLVVLPFDGHCGGKRTFLEGFSLSTWREGRVSLRPRPKRSQGDGRRGQGQRPANGPIEKEHSADLGTFWESLARRVSYASLLLKLTNLKLTTLDPDSFKRIICWSRRFF